MEYLKEVEEEFSRLLTEEMGIIRNVQTDAKNICYKILNYIETTKNNPVSLDYTSYKHGEFSDVITVSLDNIKDKPLKKEINIKWHYYSFADIETQSTQMSKIPYKTKYRPREGTLYVVIFAIKGKIDNRTLFDSVSHELTHNFQTNVKGGNLIQSKEEQDKYQRANINIGSTDNAFKWIANVVYLTNNFEQDAFLNGAYAYIMKQYEDGKDFTTSYSETEAYVSLHEMRYYLNAMQTAYNNNKVSERVQNHCKSEYDTSFKEIMNYGEKAYKRYYKKLIRMCGQALTDIDKQERMHIPYHTMTFYEPQGLNEMINKFEKDNNVFF